MTKGKIIGLRNYEDLYRYEIKKQKDIHPLFCSLFTDLKLSMDSIKLIDIDLEDLEDEYIYINEPKKNIEIHFFITKTVINFIIKTDIKQNKFNEIMKKYFIFPSK